MSVMNVKRGTNSFSKAEQNSAVKSEPVHTASASDMQAAYGDQNVGDVLNKIADPNWVDPSKKMRTSGDPSLGKDAFMKLMLTQMKYQDPTTPLQSHEMAAQLAQFSSLEQLSNIHGTLESMKTQSSPSMNYQALALIGKRVAGDSSKLSRAAGDTKHGIGFELVGDAAKVVINVKDAAGTPIKKLEVGPLKKGQNTVEWNGLKEDGTSARPGEYKISVEGQGSDGKKVFAKTSFGGKITGLNFTAEGPVLMVGNKTVKLSDVKKIEDAADDPAGAVPAAPLKSGENLLVQNEKSGKAALAATQPTPQFMKLESAKASVPPAVKTPMMPLQPGAKTMSAKTPTNPAVAAAAQAMVSAPMTASAPAATASVPEENIQPAEEDPNPANIGSVPMSRELMAQLEKQI